MDPLMVIVGSLAVWRLTHLLHAEAGPGQLLERLRVGAGVGLLGQVLGCFYCLSLWVAAPIALLIAEVWRDQLLLWLALSACAILLERVSNVPFGAYESSPREGAHDSAPHSAGSPAVFVEDPTPRDDAARRP